MRLPPEVAGFRRGPILPVGTEGGREVAYATPGPPGAGAIVELTGPLDRGVPDGAASPEAEAGLSRMLARATRDGPSRTVREGERFLLPVAGAGPLRCVETEGRYGRERAEGLVCAGVVDGLLLRLWVTMPRRTPPTADAHAFAGGIAAALRRGDAAG